MRYQRGQMRVWALVTFYCTVLYCTESCVYEGRVRRMAAQEDMGDGIMPANGRMGPFISMKG